MKNIKMSLIILNNQVKDNYKDNWKGIYKKRMNFKIRKTLNKRIKKKLKMYNYKKNNKLSKNPERKKNHRGG